MVPNKIRMSRAKNYVNDIGKLAYDCWQRVEYVSDTLVWREKAKGEQDGAPFNTKFVLIIIRIGKGNVGNAVRDRSILSTGVS